MRKVCVALLGAVLAVGSLPAITVTWNWNSYAGESLNGDTANVAIYMVYSQKQLTSGTQVVSAANVGYGTKSEVKAEGDTAGSSWASATLPDGANPSFFGPDAAGTATDEAGTRFTNSVGFGDETLKSGYYYLVVFNNKVVDQATKYAVAQAGAVGGTAVENGYLGIEGNQFVDPDGTPLPGKYLDPTWMFGTFRDAAPEPTALALLALGVAGAALRRRVR